MKLLVWNNSVFLRQAEGILGVFLALLLVSLCFPSQADELRPVVIADPKLDISMDVNQVKLTSQIESGRVVYTGTFHLFLEADTRDIAIRLGVSDLHHNFEADQAAIPLLRRRPVSVSGAASTSTEQTLEFLPGMAVELIPEVPLKTRETSAATFSAREGETFRDSLSFQLRWQLPADKLLPAGDYGGYVVIHVSTVY